MLNGLSVFGVLNSLRVLLTKLGVLNGMGDLTGRLGVLY